MRTAFLLRPDRLHGIEQDRPPGGQQGGREPRDRKHRDRADVPPLRSRHRGSVLDRRLLAELSRRASLHIQRRMQQVAFVRCIEDWQATGIYRARTTLSEFGLTSETDR